MCGQGRSLSSEVEPCEDVSLRQSKCPLILSNAVSWLSGRHTAALGVTNLEDSRLAAHGLNDRVQPTLVLLHHVQQLDQCPTRLRA